MTEHERIDTYPGVGERFKQEFGVAHPRQMRKSASTPLPWFDASDRHGIIRGGFRFATFSTRDDRDYALTACNNYEALKQSHAALMQALTLMQRYAAAEGKGLCCADEALANARKIAEGL